MLGYVERSLAAGPHAWADAPGGSLRMGVSHAPCRYYVRKGTPAHRRELDADVIPIVRQVSARRGCR